MTIEQVIESELLHCGMWLNKIQEFMPKFKDKYKDMAGRWSDSPTEYPNLLLLTLINSAKLEAANLLESENPSNFAISLLRG